MNRALAKNSLLKTAVLILPGEVAAILSSHQVAAWFVGTTLGLLLFAVIPPRLSAIWLILLLSLLAAGYFTIRLIVTAKRDW